MCNINALKCTCTCIDALLVHMHINLYRNLLQRKACIYLHMHTVSYVWNIWRYHCSQVNNYKLNRPFLKVHVSHSLRFDFIGIP